MIYVIADVEGEYDRDFEASCAQENPRAANLQTCDCKHFLRFVRSDRSIASFDDCPRDASRTASDLLQRVRDSEEMPSAPDRGPMLRIGGRESK